MREYAVQHGSKYRALSELQVETWLDRDPSMDSVDEDDGFLNEYTYNLFAFPAEDNFAGVKYPLDWVARVQAKSSAISRWMVREVLSVFFTTVCISINLKIGHEFK